MGMRRIGLTTAILISLGLGVLLGVLLGEHASVLEPIGNGFIRLLQMAVLPYFIVALPLGFGRLTYDEAKLTGLRLVGFFVLFWLICLVVVFLLPLTFPKLESASFFSTGAIAPSTEIDFVELYIPANPFHSLSSAVMPGVVLFGLALGIALIGVKEKGTLLAALSALSDALTHITSFVVKLTPIGVFALAASAAGSMTLEDLSRLQAYLIAYTVGALLLTFWLVPMLVVALTPFRYREVLQATRDPLVTGFTTGNLLVVLAMLSENCKQLFRNQSEDDRKRAESIVDVTLPISFTFPNLGVVLMLLFIPFAGWYTGNPLPLGDYPKFSILGFFSFFGSVEIGLPFLLQQLHIPEDMFQLHVVTLVYVGRVATLIAVMHLAGLALLGAAGSTGMVRLRSRRLGMYGGASIAILAGSLALTGTALDAMVDKAYTKDEVLASMQSVRYPLSAVVHREPPVGKPAPTDRDKSLLEAIRGRGVLRVGYDPEGMPFSFFNVNGKLVGFDVEMMQALANELDVGLEFFPYSKPTMAEELNEGYYDILIGGLLTTTKRIERMRFSSPYIDLHLGVVVEEDRRKEFDTLEKIKNTSVLKVGVLERPYFAPRIKSVAPHAEVVLLKSPRACFDGERRVDFVFMSAEAGSAWTLLYPSYTVFIPDGVRTTVPVAYPIGQHDLQFESVVSLWINLKRKDGTIDMLYDHWILGKTAETQKPRWSVLRDVLHWVE